MASQDSFEAIGTHWRIDIYDTLTLEQEAACFAAIRERIDIFDKHYSRFRSDSLITEMSQKAGDYTMSEDFKAMYELYEKMYEVTNGFVTPLIGQALVDAGYDANYSLEQKKALEKPEAWQEVMEYHHPILTMKKPALLDFGAAGKGYLVDIVAGVIEQHGIYTYCVDAGGDILHRNSDPIAIGLEHPEHFDRVIGVVQLKNNSLCGSSGNRRAWQGTEGKLHHIIDPKALVSPTDIASVWVMADTTMLADGLATCLFFVPAEQLRDDFHFEYLILHADYSVVHSTDFPAELFT